MNRLTQTWKRFAANQKGNAGIIFGLAAIPILAAGGAGMDYGRYVAAKTHLQAALDTAALAAAAPDIKTNALRIAAGEDMFEANVADGVVASLPHTGTIKINANKAVATGTVEVDTRFMAFAGVSKLEATVTAEVDIAKEKKAEIALVLDYSGSMGESITGGVKYEIMKDAAKNLIDDLSIAASSKVKFALVPFSHHVYTTLDGSYVVGATPSTPWTGCTQDRPFPQNRVATTPLVANNATKWGQPQAPEHLAWGCSGYVSNKLSTVDLTDKFTTLTNKLDVMKPYAWTHIALGVEFGYHMLTPNAPYTKGAPMKDGETEKFMVVLTDGMQTEPGFGPGSTRTVAQGEENLEVLCDNAKKDGITIITMAFDLDDSDTRKRLQACATDPDKHFFIANSAADLAGAFEAVKAAVTAQVYLSK
jgi:Flp pilus assembly protein TadG